MSTKVDITIPRAMTLAPRQFENIKPSISVTAKDIPLENLQDAYKNLSDLVHGLFLIEFANTYVLYKDIENNGINDYAVELISNQLDQVQENINEAFKNLSNILTMEKF